MSAGIISVGSTVTPRPACTAAQLADIAGDLASARPALTERERHDAMLAHGVFVTAFSYPVVPKGAARIRVQLSAAHSEDDVRACVEAFVAALDLAELGFEGVVPERTGRPGCAQACWAAGAPLF